MDRDCGPILHLRGVEADQVALTAIIVSRGDGRPSPLRHAGADSVAPEAIWYWRGRTVWRYDFTLTQPTDGSPARYTIGEKAWDVALPGKRLRAAFTACNGDHDHDDADFDSPERNERWRDLSAEHARDPFHVLLQGGDQLYADDLWLEVDELVDWERLPRQRQLTHILTPEGEAAIAEFYFSRYCRLWSQRDLKAPLASIPSLMMWDDHDIFDGWGSHKDEWQHCPVYQAIWRQARRHFMIFQLGCAPDDAGDASGDTNDSRNSHFGWVRRVGNTAIMAPDLRSERTRGKVLGRDGWHWLDHTLDALSGCRRLLFVSTVPVINVNLSLMEKMLVGIPGRQQYQDDLRDQWCSYVHRHEWHRLVTRLLDWSDANGVPVTILSGEIHFAARGRIERRDSTLDQLIASGIAHPPPPAWLARVFGWLAWPPRRAGRGTRLRMLPLPEIGRRYLAERNWLVLTCEPDGTLDACWRPDGPVGRLPLRLQGRDIRRHD